MVVAVVVLWLLLLLIGGEGGGRGRRSVALLWLLLLLFVRVLRVSRRRMLRRGGRVRRCHLTPVRNVSLLLRLNVEDGGKTGAIGGGGGGGGGPWDSSGRGVRMVKR